MRVETLAPAMIHWSSDRWQTTYDTQSRDTGMGVHVTDLSTETLSNVATMHVA